MADITKCNNEQCTANSECYRFTAVSSYHQAWFTMHPDHVGNCAYFIPNYPCGYCDGTGEHQGGSINKCRKCNGTGKVLDIM